MAKVAIDNGHGLNTAGKRTPPLSDGRVIREWEFNYPTAKKLKQVLERCGLETIMVSDTQEDTPLAIRTSRANNANADIFVSIHYNAFKGEWGTHGGVETHYYPSSTKGKKLAELVQAELAKATGLRNRGIWASNFYVLRKTKMPAILCECGFMDNLEEAKLMLDENYQWTVAEAIGRGICAYLGVKYVPKPEPKKEEAASGDKLYKVQVGAFKERKNAEALLEKLKKAGFDGFIKSE
ncbi:MAG: N-acetylmuramoyl-L-alanine amidase [Thermoanaerobacteraceae bacterium]|nr:N-acetylmuramoyl-L-alanine amidase [Thermoanaerobacteraceae bacterium]